MQFKWITPSLAVVMDDDWPMMFTADEVSQAVDWIELGHTAYVDSDDTAKAILRALGLPDDHVEDRLLFASSGRIGL
jgi:hypothetical protein